MDNRTEVMMVSRAKVAVQIMRHLCTCPEHGYSWPGRYGTSGYCSVKTDAGTIKVKKGDRDCSSACCEAWELTLEGTPYAGKITKFHTTWDMREMFVNSGLFSWKNMGFNASPGDVYLDEDQHTAMCIQNDGNADLLGEFSISEHGTTDGEPGDQTGQESSIHGYYEAWDGILHYNGKADTVEFKNGTYTTTSNLYVRDKRAKTGTLYCTIAKGAKVKLDAFAKNSAGNTWARIASGDHKGRFVCVRLKDGTTRIKK